MNEYDRNKRDLVRAAERRNEIAGIRQRIANRTYPLDARMNHPDTVDGLLSDARTPRPGAAATPPPAGPSPEPCRVCRGTGAAPGSDNLNWLPCTACQGRASHGAGTGERAAPYPPQCATCGGAIMDDDHLCHVDEKILHWDCYLADIGVLKDGPPENAAKGLALGLILGVISLGLIAVAVVAWLNR